MEHKFFDNIFTVYGNNHNVWTTLTLSYSAEFTLISRNIATSLGFLFDTKILQIK